MSDDWEKDDELWKVLGHAREPRVSPFFARRVRNSLPFQTPAWAGLLRWAAAGVLGVCLFGFSLSLWQPVPDGVTGDFVATFDAVAGIDAMVAASSPVPEDVLIY